MLRATAVGNRVPQAEFDAVVPGLREELIEAQYDLREDTPVEEA